MDNPNEVTKEEIQEAGKKFTDWMADRLEYNAGSLPPEAFMTMDNMVTKLQVAGATGGKADLTVEEGICLGAAVEVYLLDL
jgi:hypothetical protein